MKQNKNENKYRGLTPRQYIRRLYDDTENGALKITYYPFFEEPYTMTYQMDWDEQRAEQMMEEYDRLSGALEQIAACRELTQAGAAPEKLLTPELLAVWETYVKPFPAFEESEQTVNELYLRAQFDSLDPEEDAVLDNYFWWRENHSLARLPFMRRSPYMLVLHAQRYEKFASMGAPEAVLQEEGRSLAEELVLYHYGPQQKQATPED